MRAVGYLVEEERDFVAGDLTRDLDDVLGVRLRAAHFPEVVARERDLSHLAVLPDMEGAPSAALELHGLRLEGTVEGVVDLRRAHAVLEEIAGGTQGAGARGVVGEAPGIRDDRHPEGLGRGAVEGPFHPLGDSPDDLARGGGLRVNDRHGAGRDACGVVVDGEGGQFLGKGTHFGGETAGGGAIHVDEQIELPVPEAAEGNQVGHALKETGLAEGMDIRRGEGLVPGGGEQARKGDHRAKRVPVRPQMARNEDAPRFRQQLLGRHIVGTIVHFVPVAEYDSIIGPI